MLDKELAIYCADIGAVQKNNFGWARIVGGQSHEDSCIFAFVDDVAASLKKEQKVALGFECPLWVPVSQNPKYLTKARRVDGNRAYSAGAGANVLVTGITQVAWILHKLRSRLEEAGTSLPKIHLDWSDFIGDDSGLFFWEAFISGKAKSLEAKHTRRHAQDALIACKAFADRLPEPVVDYESEPRVRSLIGGAILWSGWSTSLKLLHMPSIVIRPHVKD